MYFIVVPFCSTEMFEKVRKLSSVLKNIPGDIKPRQNQTEKVEIGIYMALNSMQDYDEVSGILKMSASFILSALHDIVMAEVAINLALPVLEYLTYVVFISISLS
jgi:hypothetical protein